LRKLAIGYFLCTVNSSVFLTAGQTLFLALATYPVSVVAIAVGVLGALTYVLVAGAFVFERSDTSGFMLLYAAVPWTVYSFLEAASYVRFGRLSRIPTFYAAVVSVPAVLYFDAVVMSLLVGAKLPEGPEPTFLVWGGFLMLSGLVAGISFLRYKPKSRILAAPSGQYAPIRARAESWGSMQATVETSRLAGAVTARPARPAQRVRVEVVARGNSIVCRRCGRESPLTSSSCASCGAAFQKATYGLRCPACSAPLKIAKRISSERFVCTQCFSDLRVYLAS
jgi:ribosomal protein L37E